MKTTAHIERIAELRSLAAFRQFLADECAGKPGVTGEVLYDLQLAVDEACTNIVIHGYESMEPGMIQLSLEFAPDRLTIEIADQGRSFQPDRIPEPDISLPLEERSLGGMGLYLIHKSVDEVKYEARGDRNVMRLIKRLRPA